MEEKNKKTPEEKKEKTGLEEKVEEKKSKPAVSKIPKKEKKDEKIELEREYVVPLKRESIKVPRYKRAKKAIKALKEFLARHMKVRDRDLRKIKVDIHLNNEIWHRGIKKPLNKVRVHAVKKSGIVYVELAEIPDVVKYRMAKEEKKSKSVSDKRGEKKEEKKEDDKEKAKETEEKEKSSVEAGLKEQKKAAKEAKHTAKGDKAKKTMPVRKVLR